MVWALTKSKRLILAPNYGKTKMAVPKSEANSLDA